MVIEQFWLSGFDGFTFFRKWGIWKSQNRNGIFFYVSLLVCIKGLHGPEPGPRPVPRPAWQMTDDFSTDRAKPSNERCFFQRAGKWNWDFFPTDRAGSGYKKRKTKNIECQTAKSIAFIIIIIIITECVSKSSPSFLFS